MIPSQQRMPLESVESGEGIMLKEFEKELLKRFSDDYRKASKKRKREILNQFP
ncbi:MAG: hypothetical protein J7J73_02055 [Deltaproteobacteria bacterium]|nr:hypothetical protein [Deltaproteobacteria bacterium]